LLLIIDYQVSRMRARSHITCLLLLAIGPTLVVPVEKWHHHEHGAQEREACELCIAAAGAVPNIQPAPSLPPPDFVLFNAVWPEFSAGVLVPALVLARGPP